jgi:hypothetical protein
MRLVESYRLMVTITETRARDRDGVHHRRIG